MTSYQVFKLRTAVEKSQHVSYFYSIHLPFDHVILSKGNPLAGQITRNALPTTAFSSVIGCTNGGPKRIFVYYKHFSHSRRIYQRCITYQAQCLFCRKIILLYCKIIVQFTFICSISGHDHYSINLTLMRTNWLNQRRRSKDLKEEEIKFCFIKT